MLVLTGIVPEIIPASVPVNVPIRTGLAKLPLSSDNSAVKMFPAVKISEIVKGTETEVPAQNGDPVIVPVVIVPDTFTFTSLLVTISQLNVEIQTT